MGLFDRFKKKFEDAGSQKKVKHVVANASADKKKKTTKSKDSSGLTPEELKAAQAMESQAKAPVKKDEKGKKPSSAKQKVVPRDTKLAYKILIKPLITEKASSMGSEGKYVFEIHPRASKAEVRKAIQAAYDITPISINIIRRVGKDIRFGLQRGRTKGRKKAIVSLPAGKTIDVYQS